MEGIRSACVHALAWARTFAAEDICNPLEDISCGRFPVEDIALHVCMLLLGRRTHLLQKTICYPVEDNCCGTFPVEGICSAYEHAVAWVWRFAAEALAIVLCCAVLDVICMMSCFFPPALTVSGFCPWLAAHAPQGSFGMTFYGQLGRGMAYLPSFLWRL